MDDKPDEELRVPEDQLREVRISHRQLVEMPKPSQRAFVRALKQTPDYYDHYRDPVTLEEVFRFIERR